MCGAKAGSTVPMPRNPKNVALTSSQKRVSNPPSYDSISNKSVASRLASPGLYGMDLGCEPELLSLFDQYKSDIIEGSNLRQLSQIDET
jgi:hypothetical protein